MNAQELFKEISIDEADNAHKLIAKDWMLITAKDGDGANAMTASWGCLGELWNTPVAICFIRPQRYTFELAEKEERLSLAFFDGEQREALKLCGRVSGRDRNKLDEAGLTVVEIDGVPVISEAKLLVIGRKLYADFLREDSFLDKTLLGNYEKKDYHKMYVLGIEKVLVRK